MRLDSEAVQGFLGSLGCCPLAPGVGGHWNALQLGQAKVQDQAFAIGPSRNIMTKVCGWRAIPKLHERRSTTMAILRNTQRHRQKRCSCS